MICGLCCELFAGLATQLIDNKQIKGIYWRAEQDQSEYWNLEVRVS